MLMQAGVTVRLTDFEVKVVSFSVSCNYIEVFSFLLPAAL